MKRKSQMTELTEGQTAKVAEINSQDNMRRRLFDLGLIEGTRIKCLQKSPSGDPIAYSVRGAVIALRRADSANITVTF